MGRERCTLGSKMGLLRGCTYLKKKNSILCYLLNLLPGFIFTLFPPTSFHHQLTKHLKTAEKRTRLEYVLGEMQPLPTVDLTLPANMLLSPYNGFDLTGKIIKSI